MSGSRTILCGECRSTKAGSSPGSPGNMALIDSVYFEAFDSIIEARAREHSMKRWRRAWKIKLIEEFNPDWDDLTSN